MMRFCKDWLLLPQRLALHEPSATAVLADLHLGYSTVRQRLGDAIPARSVRDEMQPLLEAAKMHDIRAIVVAGDLFERGYDLGTWTALLDILEQTKIELKGLVPGNHDRGLDKAPAPLLVFTNGIDMGGWRIVHGDQPTDTPRTICGHWHPAVRRRGRKTPCFLMRGEYLILPAFSLDSAGADVAKENRWNGWECAVCSGGEVLTAKRARVTT